MHSRTFEEFYYGSKFANMSKKRQMKEECLKSDYNIRNNLANHGRAILKKRALFSFNEFFDMLANMGQW